MRWCQAWNTRVAAKLPLAAKLEAVQEAMVAGRRWARRVYDSYGVYLGYAICHFSEFYEFSNLLVLGRVASGPGGQRMLDKAREVLRREAPQLAERIAFVAPDETFKRHGQAIAAASLPVVESEQEAGHESE